MPKRFFSSWSQFAGREVVATRRARTAIAMACRALGVGRDHEVLVPAYNCGTEVDAILHVGATVTLYRVDGQCRIDLDDLSSRLTSRTRAVYVIHYFGWEQPLSKIREWCDQNNLLLIEDCALALFSDGPSGQLGRLGDASVFSLPKTLGSAFGGLLSCRGGFAAQLSTQLRACAPGDNFAEFRTFVRSPVRRFLKQLGADRLRQSLRIWRRSPPGPHLDEEPTDLPGNYYYSLEQDDGRAIPFFTSQIVSRAIPARIVAQRRRNYLHLASGMARCPELIPLFETLPSGVCPLNFPVRVARRSQSFGRLRELGVEAIPWWAGFHRAPLGWKDFPEAADLKNSVIALPVHQWLTDRDLDLISVAMQSVSRRLAGADDS